MKNLISLYLAIFLIVSPAFSQEHKFLGIWEIYNEYLQPGDYDSRIVSIEDGVSSLGRSATLRIESNRSWSEIGQRLAQPYVQSGKWELAGNNKISLMILKTTVLSNEVGEQISFSYRNGLLVKNFPDLGEWKALETWNKQGYQPSTGLQSSLKASRPTPHEYSNAETWWLIGAGVVLLAGFFLFYDPPEENGGGNCEGCDELFESIGYMKGITFPIGIP